MVSNALYPLIQMGFRVSQGPMFNFRLVLLGHTDCTTCKLRTTKQKVFFVLFIC